MINPRGAGMSVRLGLYVSCVIAAALAVSQAVVAGEAAAPVELRPETFDTGLYWVKRAAFSHDGRLLAFLGYSAPNSLQDLEVTVFDVGSRRLVKTLSVPNSSPVTLKGGIAFSPDDARLAVGANEITIWDTHTWTEAGRAPGPFADGPFGADDLLGLAYTPDGLRIIAAYGKVWGPGEVHVGSQEAFIRLTEARRLAYASGNAPEVYQRPEIEVLDASTGARLKRFAIARDGRRGDRSRITSGLAVSRDGGAAYVALSDYEGILAPPPSPTPTPRITVERVDLESGQVSAVFERRQEDDFTALAVNADQSLFATGELVGGKHNNHVTTDPVRLWNTSDGGLRSELGPPAGAVWQLLLPPDGSGVIACQTDNRSHNLMAVWDTKTKTLVSVVHVETLGPAVVSCALSQDGRQAVLTVPFGGSFGGFAHDTAYLADLTSVGQ